MKANLSLKSFWKIYFHHCHPTSRSNWSLARLSIHIISLLIGRCGKDYSLAPKYDEDDSRLEIILEITQTCKGELETMGLLGQEAERKEPKVIQNMGKLEESK